MTDYLEWYFIEHYERIKLTIDLLRDIVKDGDTILDLGSIFPISTYWYSLHKNAKVTCADICTKNWRFSDNLYSSTIDLNKTMIKIPGGWPIINFQEVIEHLTCNLKKARDRIVSALKPGGYLLAGYPIVSIGFSLGRHPPGVKLNSKSGEKVSVRPCFEAELFKAVGAIADHKREFLLEECETFFPLEIIASKVVFTIGYTRGTALVLYRKD